MNQDIFPKGSAWIEGEFVDISQAKISILDWGFLRSDATYDVVHVWKGRFFRLDDHINRFFESTKSLRMPCTIPRSELKKILAGCVKHSGLKDAYVEMIQTRGISKDFQRDPRKAIPTFMAFAVPFGWILEPQNFEKGLDVIISDRKRISSKSIDPKIKNYHWLDLVCGMYEAYDLNSDTVILTDDDDNLLEGPGFNIFCINENGMHTPMKGILEGITRKTVLELAKEIKLPTQRGLISKKMFTSSIEIFATSTAGGIMPITSVNGLFIGNGSPGQFTRKLYDEYWKKHYDSNWSEDLNDILR